MGELNKIQSSKSDIVTQQSKYATHYTTTKKSY